MGDDAPESRVFIVVEVSSVSALIVVEVELVFSGRRRSDLTSDKLRRVSGGVSSPAVPPKEADVVEVDMGEGESRSPGEDRVDGEIRWEDCVDKPGN